MPGPIGDAALDPAGVAMPGCGDLAPPGRLERDRLMSAVQLPVSALTVLGIVIVALGLLVAGNVILVALGLGSVAVAGLLAVAGARRA